MCVCLTITALFCLISLLISIAILLSNRVSSLCFLSPRLPHLLSLFPSLSLSYLCLLYLCLVPPPSLPSSCTCFTFVATSVPVSLLPPPTPPPTSPIYLSRLCLILISICVPVSLLSLSPSFSITVSVPFSPCLRLCLLSSSTSSVPISGPVSSSSLSSFPLLSHLRSPFRDGTSLGAGPRDWIGITRLSGRIELTSSHERRRACFPSLLRGRRWGGQGEGSGPYGWARCID